MSNAHFFYHSTIYSPLAQVSLKTELKNRLLTLSRQPETDRDYQAEYEKADRCRTTSHY